MRRPFLAVAALLAALLLPNLAAAQSVAYAVGSSNMRAGPGLDFPVIAVVAGGSQVNVIGCLSDYAWCDASVQGIRGWVSTTRLEFLYGGRRVLVPSYTGYFGAPVIGFDFGYWDYHYRDRPFYRDRGRWDRGWRRPRDRERPVVYDRIPGDWGDGTETWIDGRGRPRRDRGRDREVFVGGEPEYRDGVGADGEPGRRDCVGEECRRRNR